MTALKQNQEREGNPARVSAHTGSASTFSHYEISLLLFALQGGNAAPMPDASDCEEACPVIESVEELLCGGTLDREQQLVRHLNNHLREALIECGLFEFMASHSREGSLSSEDQTQLELANARLMQWSCEIKLDRERSRAAVGFSFAVTAFVVAHDAENNVAPQTKSQEAVAGSLGRRCRNRASPLRLIILPIQRTRSTSYNDFTSTSTVTDAFLRHRQFISSQRSSQSRD